VDSFWGGGKEEPHRKNELYGEVWSAGGEWQWGQRPGVVVDSSRCWEVVHGGVVLGAWSNRSEGGRSGLSTATQRRRNGGGGVKGRGRRKGAPRWGWAPFIAARGGGRRAAQRGGETGGGNQRPQLERRRHGLGANVQTVGLTRGPHAVLIFPIYPELAQFGNQKRMPYLTQKIPKFCMLLD
jgi:hypothetical protein